MSRLKVITSVILAGIIVTSTGCSSKKSIDVNRKYTIKAKELSEPVDKVSTANNKLTFKFLNETLKENRKDNIIVSPLSLSAVLSLTQNGASGKTKEEMLEALEMKGYDDKTINESYKNIIAHYNSLKTIETKLGDSVWIRKDAKVKKDFKDTAANYYEAEANEVDFTKKKTLDTINKWVADQTAGKIEKIIEKFEPNTFMALINTVYFKGKWSKPFEKNNTAKQKFTSTDGSVKQVDMMKDSMGVEYLKESNFEAVRIPYEDNNFGMYIFLPNQGQNVDNLMKYMTFDNWNKWMKSFNKKQVQVSIPKFKIEFEQKLNDMLKNFGMKSAFEDGADFSRLSDNNQLSIELVKQKSYIDVNESGTEAASATAVVIREVSAPIDDNIKFTADRPFVYAIADKKTGLILFMGKVEKP